MITEMSWADGMNGAVTAVTVNSTTNATSDWEFRRTTDGGETWTRVDVEDNFFTSFSLVPGTPGMIVITTSKSDFTQDFSAYSTDWGTNWEILDDSIQYLYVRMYDKNTGWAGGFNWDENNGGIYKWKGISGLNFTSLPVTEIAAGAEYSYTVTAESTTETEDCDITISLTSGPEWLTFANGVLSGTAPSITTLSESYNVVLTATNCEDTTTQSFTVTVRTTNTAPVFVSEPVTQAVKGVEYVYNIECEDADNDPLTITATNKPSWAEFTDNGDGTATLRGTSNTVTTVGSGIRVTLVVADGLYETSQTYNIVTVNSVDDFGMGAIAIYPNPNDGMFNITNCEGSTYEIIDVTGRIVANGTINSSVEAISFNTSATGNFVIRIINGEKVINRAIVKF